MPANSSIKSGPIETVRAASRRAIVWAGRIVVALAVLSLIRGANARLADQHALASAFIAHYCDPNATIAGIGLLKLSFLLLYVPPMTALFGALLMTTYLRAVIAKRRAIVPSSGHTIPPHLAAQQASK